MMRWSRELMLRGGGLVFLAWLASCTPTPDLLIAGIRPPASTSQVVLSITDTWSQSAATLQCMERVANGWRCVGRPIAARVGRNGLGWGVGLHVDGEGPLKREGDGQGPAGVFPLLDAFGYAEQPPASWQVSYRWASDRDYYVDAPSSPDYNQWRRIPEGEPNDPAERWRSCERMRRDDALYEYGMIVGHNLPEAIPERGSAIFLHVWSGPDGATSGCTSMAKEDLLRVLGWLRASHNPWLVQVPEAALSTLQLRGR